VSGAHRRQPLRRSIDLPAARRCAVFLRASLSCHSSVAIVEAEDYSVAACAPHVGCGEPHGREAPAEPAVNSQLVISASGVKPIERYAPTGVAAGKGDRDVGEIIFLTTAVQRGSNPSA
jgi:hypothetical protein